MNEMKKTEKATEKKETLSVKNKKKRHKGEANQKELKREWRHRVNRKKQTRKKRRQGGDKKKKKIE